MANKEDKDKLNKCLEILDTTDLGLSLIWLWTWSTMKDIMDDVELDILVSENDAWDLLCQAVDSGYGFTMEYGAEDHYESVRDWMFEKELVKDMEDEDGSN